MHPFSAYGQQFGMLGGHQGADEVERPLFDRLEIFLRVIPLVKNQRDVLDPLAEGPASLGQFFSYAGEGRGIMLVAPIGVVQQGDVAVGGDQERQTQEAQVVPSLFAMPPLGECGPVVEGVDEGEKVGGIKDQTTQIEAKARDGGGSALPFDEYDGLGVDPLHVVPKPLAAQLRSLDADQSGKDSLLIPVADLGLASGGNTAVEGSQEEVLPYGGTLGAAFGDMAVNGGDDIELLGHVEGGGHRAKFSDDGFLGIGTGESEDQLLGGADVFLPDDLGFAVDASAFAQVVIGSPADEFLSEASH